MSKSLFSLEYPPICSNSFRTSFSDLPNPCIPAAANIPIPAMTNGFARIAIIPAPTLRIAAKVANNFKPRKAPAMTRIPFRFFVKKAKVASKAFFAFWNVSEFIIFFKLPGTIKVFNNTKPPNNNRILPIAPNIPERGPLTLLFDLVIFFSVFLYSISFSIFLLLNSNFSCLFRNSKRLSLFSLS